MTDDTIAVGARDAVFLWHLDILLQGCENDVSNDTDEKDLSEDLVSSHRPPGTGTDNGLFLTLYHPGVHSVRLLPHRRMISFGGFLVSNWR